MKLANKLKITPTDEQLDVLWKLSEKCRLVYNFALNERKELPTLKSISYVNQQNQLPKLKSQFPEYRWVYSKVLQMTLKKLDADCKSYYALKNKYPEAKPPKYKGKKHFTTMTYNQSGFKLNSYNNKNTIKFSHKYNDIPLEFEIFNTFNFNISDKLKVYEVSIFKDKIDNNFYISIVYEQDALKYFDNDKYQAFDLGSSKHQAVNTSGKFINFKLYRPDIYWNNKIKEVQSRRDRCKKYSKKWNYFHSIYKKYKHKCANQLKDYQHKLSHKIINNTKANTIIVGDLHVKSLCKLDKYNKSLHKGMHGTGNIGRFVRFLTYKAELSGKKLIKINEAYTTKMCCCCNKEHDMPISKRIMNCDCGNVIDRDENSSVNIMLRYLSQNGLWTAYRQFVDILRQTGMPIRDTLVGSPNLKTQSV